MKAGPSARVGSTSSQKHGSAIAAGREEADRYARYRRHYLEALRAADSRLRLLKDAFWVDRPRILVAQHFAENGFASWIRARSYLKEHSREIKDSGRPPLPAYAVFDATSSETSSNLTTSFDMIEHQDILGQKGECVSGVRKARTAIAINELVARSQSLCPSSHTTRSQSPSPSSHWVRGIVTQMKNVLFQAADRFSPRRRRTESNDHA